MLFEIFDPKAAPRPIGIDLGTTNSLVAYVQDGKPHAVLDCDLEVLVPSVVSYDERGNVVVGRAAQRRALSSPRETIVSVKRFMGRGANDPETRRLGPYEFAAPKDEADANVVRFKVRERLAVEEFAYEAPHEGDPRRSTDQDDAVELFGAHPRVLQRAPASGPRSLDHRLDECLELGAVQTDQR